MRAVRCLLLAAVSVSCGNVVKADLIVDLSHDVAAGGMIDSNPLARAALDAAVRDLNSVLDISLAPITSGVTVGTGGGANVTVDWDWGYRNPSTGVLEQWNGGSAVLPGNDVVVFAGMSRLTGGVLGEGGPGGLTSNVSVSGNFAGIQAAFNDAMANSQMHRGGGPIVRRTTGGFLGASYAFDHGASIGAITFDSDSDNNGVVDSAAMLDQYWHFDHTTPVASGKFDFYSVALHELVHSIGFGTSLSWDENTSGDDWLGQNVATVHGTGLNILDGSHFSQNVVSQTINGGNNQTPLMAPFLVAGTRSYLTEIDVAALNDIGWQSQVSAVPEPSSFVSVMVLGLLTGCGSRRRSAA